MAYSSIIKPTDYFNTKLYTGNATDNTAITGVGFTPSFLWGKNITDNGTNHYLINAVRGVTKELNTNSNSAEGTDATLIKSFDSDGFTLGDGSLNQSGKNFVSWNWKANGQGSSNTDGSINTTYTSVNTTSGFSISKYTGAGSTSTVGHGLGVAPKVMIIKCLSNAGNWQFYHEDLGNNKKLLLNTTSAEISSGYMNSTSPTNQVFTVINDADVGTSGYTYIAYCFAEKTGYSKFGSYTGNNNANGVFVYTGFKPAWVLFKRSSSTENWSLYDNKRLGYNPQSYGLRPNIANAESQYATTASVDFVSNGFKIREAGSNINDGTYIYMAFAEAPLVGSNNVPATAR